MVVRSGLAAAVLVAAWTGAAAGELHARRGPPLASDTDATQKRILERTGGPHRTAGGLLEGPASLAAWINRHRERQVAISVELKR